MRKLNVKLFLSLVALTGMLTGGVFLVHHLQSGRIAHALLAQTERAENEGRFDQAVKFLGRYLEFVPQDIEERAHLGRLLAGEHFAESPRARQRAFFVLQEVLRRDPSRADLRRQLVEVAMDPRLQRYADAQKNLENLLEVTPDDGELERLYASCHEALGQYREAVVWYEKAIQHAPQQGEAYTRLADLLRRRLSQDQPGESAARADKVVDRLVSANPQSSFAYLARWEYRRQWNLIADAHQLDEAAEDVNRALALAPKEADALLAAAELALHRRQLEPARRHLDEGLRLYPQDLRFYQARASLEIDAGQQAQAIACLREGIKASRGAGQVDLLWTLGNVLMDAGQSADATGVIEQMRKAGASASALDYMNARLLIAQGRWPEAVKLLERARPQLEVSPRLAYFVDLFLGECYAQLDEPGQQLATYTRLVGRERASAAGHLGLAAALTALGRVDDALEQYRRAMACPNAPTSGWIGMAKLLIQRNRQREVADWTAVEQILQDVEAADPKSLEVPLLRAECWLARNQPGQAEKVLLRAREAQPKQIAFWTALAALATQNGDVSKSVRLLDEAEQRLGDSVELRIARARYWSSRRGPDAAAALAKLGENLGNFKEEPRALLLRSLAAAHYQLGNIREAENSWAEVAALPRFQNEARVKLILFDLARQAGDEPTMERVLTDFHRLEGGPGTYWRFCEASHLIWKAKRGDPVSLDDARAHLDTVASRRSSWPAVLLTKAELETLKGRPDQAIALYREAINLGEVNPHVVRLLVQLLYQRQRYQEADQEIRKLQQKMALSSDWQRLAVDVSLKNQDPARAVQMAFAMVSTDSKDYRDHLWLGQVLASSGGKAVEAEDSLRRAVELAEQVPETWVALVQFLAGVGKSKQAEDAIAQARQRLPESQRSLALAQCNEAVGRLDLARKDYQEALAMKPEDIVLLRALASFYLRTGRSRDAEPVLRQLLDTRQGAPAAEAAWARRNLAWALAADGDYRQFPEALTLVGLALDPAGTVTETKKSTDSDAVEEQVARARVLATQPQRALRAHAITILEAASRQQGLLPDDQFLLAQLYESAGLWPKARDELRSLTTGAGANLLYLSYYARNLLQRRELEEAHRCIDRLEQMNNQRQARREALSVAELKALLFEAREQWDQAHALFKVITESKTAQPESALLLIGHLVRRKRFAEALDQCEAAWQRCPPEKAGGVTIAVLRAAGASDVITAGVERRLRAEIDKHPQASMLKLHLADLQDLRGRFDEAEKLYREVLKHDANNIVALNNLAWLLAEHSGKGAEALPFIDQAIAFHGPRADLLDTRAVVCLSLGRGEAAIADLERANADNPVASRWFHLARAHQLAKNSRAALDAFQKAQQFGLKPDHLHPVERVAFRKIAAELDQR